VLSHASSGLATQHVLGITNEAGICGVACCIDLAPAHDVAVTLCHSICLLPGSRLKLRTVPVAQYATYSLSFCILGTAVALAIWIASYGGILATAVALAIWIASQGGILGIVVALLFGLLPMGVSWGQLWLFYLDCFLWGYSGDSCGSSYLDCFVWRYPGDSLGVS
jgi:hypothetical protein